jgi:hypothetical protein
MQVGGYTPGTETLLPRMKGCRIVEYHMIDVHTAEIQRLILQQWRWREELPRVYVELSKNDLSVKSKPTLLRVW